MGAVAISVMWLGRFEYIFIFFHPVGTILNLVTAGLVASEMEIVILWESWVKD